MHELRIAARTEINLEPEPILVEEVFGRELRDGYLLRPLTEKVLDMSALFVRGVIHIPGALDVSRLPLVRTGERNGEIAVRA